MWNDKDTSIDLIDYDHLVKAVQRIIENDDLIPSTIGIFGDWGSGKSSLMRMVEESYEDEDEILTVKFNGWLFEGYEDAKSVLMGTILEEITSNRTLSEEAKKLAVKLFKKIDWLKLAKYGLKYGVSLATMGPVGLGIAALSDIPNKLGEIDYEKFVKSPDDEDQEESLRTSIREFHLDFKKLLSETKISKLIVFIDDLDRCMPDTIIDTLEAIKLFLYTNNTVFIISADEQLIKYAVSKRFPRVEGIRDSVSSDYLEKLIQHPIRIPQLGAVEIETYINLLFTELHIKEGFEDVREKVLQKKNESVFGSVYTFDNCEVFFDSDSNTSDLREDLILSSQVTSILTEGLNGNPRQCKRFLNMLMMRIGMANDKKLNIKKRILSKLMLLEYFRTETFRNIFKLQSSQDGKPAEINFIEGKLVGTTDKDSGEEQVNETIESEADIDLWLKDEWMIKWFKMEPQLSEVDLRPYFYLSRDRITSLSTESIRMSPRVEELLNKLLSQSDALKEQALKEVPKLNSIDANIIFQILIKKVNQSEDDIKRENILKSLNKFCVVRKELLSELFSFYNKVPIRHLNYAVVPQLQLVVKGTPYSDNLIELLEKWSQDEKNKPLATISLKTLRKK